MGLIDKNLIKNDDPIFRVLPGISLVIVTSKYVDRRKSFDQDFSKFKFLLVVERSKILELFTKNKSKQNCIKRQRNISERGTTDADPSETDPTEREPRLFRNKQLNRVSTAHLRDDK